LKSKSQTTQQVIPAVTQKTIPVIKQKVIPAHTKQVISPIIPVNNRNSRGYIPPPKRFHQ
jgi:hypothetical protein